MRTRVVKFDNTSMRFREVNKIKTSVEIGKKLLFLPYGLEQSIELAKKVIR